MAPCSSIRLSALSHTCMGDSASWPCTTDTINKSVSIRAPCEGLISSGLNSIFVTKGRSRRKEGRQVSSGRPKAILQDAGLGRKVRMPQPQTVEGTLGNLDMDICKDNALGKAFYTLGRPSVRVSCQVQCMAHNLSKIPMPSMHYLKRETSLSKACMARCSQTASAPSVTRAWGFSPMATRELH
jgi:hypothetical protein